MNSTVKKSFISADVYTYSVDSTATRTRVPRAGDLAIFEVLALGKHTAIQDVTRRLAHIFPGDRFAGVFGNRYATAQFEGYVPTVAIERLHVLGQGGVVGLVKSTHATMPKPTAVKLLGYAVDDGGSVINTKYYARPRVRFTGELSGEARVLLSLGSSMDSGKTTTAGYLARSLKQIGKTVAYLKLTGTVFSKDSDFNRDCGADFATDFSQFGYPSTYLCGEDEILDLYQTLLNDAATIQPDFIIVEIADGLYQRETAMLLRNRRFLSTVSGVLFSAGDSLSAINGIEILSAIGLPPAAICGRYTMSPLLIDEVKAQTNIPTATLEQILSQQFADYIVRLHKSDTRLEPTVA